MSIEHNTTETTNRSYRLRDWTVHLHRNMLVRDQQQIVLEPKLTDILSCLIDHHGQVVSKTQLLDEVWSGRFVVDGVLKRGISKLRTALEDDAKDPKFIHTVQRRGYYLACEAIPIVDEDTVPPVPQSAGCPFLGLSSFEFGDSHLFYGRQRQINEVVSALARQRQAGRSFVLISGPSGCGKSSLAKAGVLPALSEANKHSRSSAYSVVRFGQYDLSPKRALANALLQESAFKHTAATSDLLTEYLCDGDNAIVSWLEGHLGQGERLILIIDQMEELFSNAVDAVQRNEIITIVYSLARSSLVDVLATLRNDMFHRFAEFEELASLRGQHGHVEIASPSTAQLSEIIRGPALRNGLKYETADTGRRLDDVILNEAQNHAHVLPLLEFTLSELYEHRSDDGMLTFSAYEKLGRLEGCVARRAEQTYQSLARDTQQELPQILSSLVAAGPGMSNISLRAASVPGDDDAWQGWPLVKKFVDARLFTLSKSSHSDVRQYEISHEAVLKLWPRAHDWLTENLQTLRSHAWLQEQAFRWRESNFRRDYLLQPGRQIVEAENLKRSIDLTDLESEYVSQSLVRSTRKHHVRRGAAASLGVLVIVALLTTALAVRHRSLAVDESIKSQRIAEVLSDVFSSADPSLGNGQTVTAHQLLDSGSQRIRNELQDQPDVAASLLYTMGTAYMGLGEYSQARQLFDQSQRLITTKLGQSEQELLTRVNIALSQTLRELGEVEAASDTLRTTKEILLELDRMDSVVAADYFEENGVLAYVNGELSEALGSTQSSLRLREQLLPGHSPKLADSHVNLGAIQNASGRPMVAESHYLRAIEIYQNDDERSATKLAAVLNNLANVYRTSGRLELAEDSFRKALEIHQRVYSTTHPSTAGIESNLGSTLRDLGRLEDASDVLSRAYSTLSEQLGDQHPTTSLVAVKLADVFILREKLGQAEKLLHSAKNNLKQNYPDDHFLVAHVMGVMGTLSLFEGNFEDAESQLLQSASDIESSVGSGSPFYQDVLRRQIDLYRRWQKPEQVSRLEAQFDN